MGCRLERDGPRSKAAVEMFLVEVEKLPVYEVETDYPQKGERVHQEAMKEESQVEKVE